VPVTGRFCNSELRSQRIYWACWDGGSSFSAAESAWAGRSSRSV
jgi:hypothetical protein